MMPRTGSQSPVPLEVRREMIETLFGRTDILVFGCCAHMFCAIGMWLASDDRGYLLWIPLFAAALMARLIVLARIQRSMAAVQDAEELERKEALSIAVSTATSALAGSLAAYSCIADPFTVAPVIGMGVVGGTLISVVGRSFGSIRNVNVLVAACCGPVVIGFLAAGWLHDQSALYLAALPLLMVVLVSRGTAAYLHGLLLEALKVRRRSDIAFEKYEAVAASMPNGLIVVDGNQKMVEVNQEARALLPADLWQGRSAIDAVRLSLMEPDTLVTAMKYGRDLTSVAEKPLQTTDGRWLQFRVNRLGNSERRYLDEEWGGRQEGAYILTIRDVSRKVASDRELEHLARYDGLTGLAGRRWWETHSQEIVGDLPDGTLVALAVLDIDRFKLINDTLGHQVGDRVIQGVAARIRALGEPRAFTGRLGGDEFVVMLERATDEADVEAFFDRMFASLCSSFKIEGRDVEVSCSGGVIIRKAEQFDIDTDISRADMALYKVKRTARRWRLFDSAMEEEYQTTLRIKHDLKEAIEKEELQIAYHPICDVSGERIVAAEALCRWDHEEVGSIPPSQFITMAEEIGLIGRLTEYVMRRACRECMSWNSDVAVSVNLSAIDLARDGVIELIRSSLEEAALPVHRLCIEVTETVFVKDFEKTAATLSKLREMGVKTSLDDFGTGYSSLSYMHRLPLSRVKIDKSFVANIVADENQRQLFSAVVGLAKGLGFEVVVEGVEERRQLELVVAVPGVDMIQGHIFSQDLTSAEMASLGTVRRVGFKGGKVGRRVG